MRSLSKLTSVELENYHYDHLNVNFFLFFSAGKNGVKSPKIQSIFQEFEHCTALQ